MNFIEHVGKELLRDHGINTPKGIVVHTPQEAAHAQASLGNVVIKAQVPTGKRGKAGGIQLCNMPEACEAIAAKILAMHIDEHAVESLLIEQQVPIAHEYYLAVINDATQKAAAIIFSPFGGMDIEEMSAKDAGAVRRCILPISSGFSAEKFRESLDGLTLGIAVDDLIAIARQLYAAYVASDAELLEINPLVITENSDLLALDCKFVMDDSALVRQEVLAARGTPDKATDLELQAQELGLKYIELDGNIGILANGAGLTMTSMDMVRHHGGQPANFLEIGGDAYTKGTEALKLVLANKRVKSLVINFCGAFARTDVMT
ncbi:MAG: ATP-grasp domain-containing protein, partial [Pseudomonadota bacterium]